MQIMGTSINTHLQSVYQHTEIELEVTTITLPPSSN